MWPFFKMYKSSKNSLIKGFTLFIHLFTLHLLNEPLINARPWSSLSIANKTLPSRNFCESVLHSFWLWVMFNRMDVPHLVTIWWTFELLPIWGYYEFCSLNYSSMSLGLDMCFLTRADIRSRVAGSSGKRVFNVLRHRLLSKCAVWPHHVFQVFSSSPTLVIRVFYNSRPSECALVCHSHFPNDQ